MKKIRLLLLWLLALGIPVAGQELQLFTEVQAKIAPDGPDYTFQVVGEREQGAFNAYGINVLAPNGVAQMIDEFEALLPEGAEADALYVEDVNFDGYNDLRIMKYLPGGANVPYYFWLYDPENDAFKTAESFEVILSPEVDSLNRLLVSNTRVNANQTVREYYSPSGTIPVLKKREERTYNADGSSVLKVFEVKDDSGPQLVETRTLGPQE